MSQGLRDEMASATKLVAVESPRVSDPQVSLPGLPVPPQQRIHFYSSDEWEDFIREWATGISPSYVQIKRFGGSGDKGADVAAFKFDAGLEGPWDCFQGKHYAVALTLNHAAPEMLKVFRAVLDGFYVMPDTYSFFAPKGCGTALNRLLSRPSKLKEEFLKQLEHGKPLARDLDASVIARVRTMASRVDFSMFRSVEILDALEVHRHIAKPHIDPIAARLLQFLEQAWQYPINIGPTAPF